MTPPRPTRRRALVALVAAGLLAPAFVLAGAVAAYAQPNPPVITTPAGTSVGAPFATTGTTVSLVGAVESLAVQQVVTLAIDGTPQAGCLGLTVDSPGTAWSCDLPVPLGDHTITATVTADGDADGPSNPSDPVYVRLGTTDPLVVSDPADLTSGGQIVNLSGTGPALGTVTVAADSRFSPTGSPATCVTTVTSTGTWGCTFPLPDYDWWTLSTDAVDVTGAPAGSTDSRVYSAAPPKPEVTISPYQNGAYVTITSPAAGGQSSGWWEIRPPDGSGPTSSSCNSFDFGNPFSPTSPVAPTPPTDGPTISCNLTLGPGIHILSSNQWVNDANSPQRGDLIRIPNQPTVTDVEQYGSSVIVSGDFDPSDVGGFSTLTQLSGFQVTLSDEGGAICTTDLDPTSTSWSCGVDLDAGAHSYDVTASTVGFGPAPGYEGTQGGWTDGVSTAATASFTVRSAPTVTLTRGPRAISATSVVDPSAVRTAIDLYQVLSGFEGEGEGEGGGGYYSDYPANSCEGATTVTCAASGLAPGIWNVYTRSYSTWDGEGGNYSAQDDYVYIPSTPTLSAVPSSDGVVTFAGIAEPANLVTVRDVGGAAVCSATATGAGAWTCAADPGYGSFVYSASARSVGFAIDTEDPWVYPGSRSFDGFSAASASRSVVIAPPAVATPEAILSFLWKFGITDAPLGGFHPGDTFTISGDGLPPGTLIFVEMHSTPVQLGTATVDPTGSFTFTGMIPEDAEPGAHEIVVTADVPGQGIVTQSQPVTVMPSVSTDTGTGSGAPEASSDVAGSSGGSGGSGTVDRSDPAAPSGLTDGVPTVRDIWERPQSILVAGGLALGLLFLLAIPTELLTGVLTENGRRLGRGIARVDAVLENAIGWLERVTHGRAAASIVLILIVSIVMGFSDPDFGFDLVSVRAVLALGIGCFVLFYLLSWVNGLIAKRVWDVEPEIELKPLLAIFSVLGVVLSRIAGFSPGILLGVVIGLSLRRGDKRGELGVMLLQTGSLVLFAVLAWVGYSILGAAGEPTDFGGALLHDTLVAITDEALSGAAVAILPLAFLEGRVLWEHSKLAWVAAFLVIETAFVLIVLPTALAETDAAQIGSWYLALAIFGVATLILWFFMARHSRRHATDDDEAAPELDEVRAG